MNLAMCQKTGILKQTIFCIFTVMHTQITTRMSRCRSCLQAQSQLSHPFCHSPPTVFGNRQRFLV